jgi:ribosome-associated protein
MLTVKNVHIPETEFEWAFVRASGPGGQNVNKVSSKAVLRWNVITSPSLPNDIKGRLLQQQARRMTTSGDLILKSQRFRDQQQNRDDCLNRLRALIELAVSVPRARKATKPTHASHEARLQSKRRRSSVKANRRLSQDD